MPVARIRTVLEVARNIKTFLNLDVGLTRGAVPDFEQKFRHAQRRIREQDQQLKKVRERLAGKDRELKQVRQRMRNSNRKGVGQRVQPLLRSKEGAREAAIAGPVSEDASETGLRLPIPPEDLCMRVGGPSGEAFNTLGARLANDLREAFPPDFSWEDSRVLDYGCGVGRVLRHFVGHADQWREFWGCDIHDESISWLKANLSPPFRFANNLETPHLPFEDDYFDLIYGISVFTHLTEDQWEGWLKELRRITRPGGTLLLTYHNRVAYERRFNRPFDEKSVGMEVHGHDMNWDQGGPRAYHSNWWIRENWGRFLTVEKLVDHGLANWQSIAVMRKDEADALQTDSA